MSAYAIYNPNPMAFAPGANILDGDMGLANSGYVNHHIEPIDSYDIV